MRSDVDAAYRLLETRPRHEVIVHCLGVVELALTQRDFRIRQLQRTAQALSKLHRRDLESTLRLAHSQPLRSRTQTRFFHLIDVRADFMLDTIFRQIAPRAHLPYGKPTLPHPPG